MKDSVNKRSEKYGCSFENRARLLLEVVKVIVEVIGTGRVGGKLSSNGNYNESTDSDSLDSMGILFFNS